MNERLKRRSVTVQAAGLIVLPSTNDAPLEFETGRPTGGSRMRKFFVTAIVLVSSATGALAFGDDTIDANQRIQERRIENGRYFGDITRREYRELLAEQARIADMERAAKSDGYISRREYHQIHDAQLRAYRHIDQESHDGQVSFWRRWFRRSAY
jgi:hypothetical protein